MPKPVLQIESLTKRYGALTAVDQLSLEVVEGEVFGFLGPNGAGKTTTINMICGLLKPDAGRIFIHGQPVSLDNPNVRSLIGVCPQNVVLWERLTCLEQLQFMGVITACFSRSVSQAFVIANFPLAFFMFFTGAIFPIPAVTLFTIAGRPLNLYELLPPTHAVVALNKILVLGAGLREVSYELFALTVLSVVYFAIGVWLFNRMHLHRG